MNKKQTGEINRKIKGMIYTLIIVILGLTIGFFMKYFKSYANYGKFNNKANELNEKENQINNDNSNGNGKENESINDKEMIKLALSWLFKSKNYEINNDTAIAKDLVNVENSNNIVSNNTQVNVYKTFIKVNNDKKMIRLFKLSDNSRNDKNETQKEIEEQIKNQNLNQNTNFNEIFGILFDTKYFEFKNNNSESIYFNYSDVSDILSNVILNINEEELAISNDKNRNIKKDKADLKRSISKVNIKKYKKMITNIYNEILSDVELTLDDSYDKERIKINKLQFDNVLTDILDRDSDNQFKSNVKNSLVSKITSELNKSYDNSLYEIEISDVDLLNIAIDIINKVNNDEKIYNHISNLIETLYSTKDYRYLMISDEVFGEIRKDNSKKIIDLIKGDLNFYVAYLEYIRDVQIVTLNNEEVNNNDKLTLSIFVDSEGLLRQVLTKVLYMDKSNNLKVAIVNNTKINYLKNVYNVDDNMNLNSDFKMNLKGASRQKILSIYYTLIKMYRRNEM